MIKYLLIFVCISFTFLDAYEIKIQKCNVSIKNKSKKQKEKEKKDREWEEKQREELRRDMEAENKKNASTSKLSEEDKAILRDPEKRRQFSESQGRDEYIEANGGFKYGEE